VFDNCTVFCKNSGYVTAASTLDTVRYGFVFINCKITGDAPANSFYLGRPWRPFAKTVFINCYLDKQIKPEGWHNWDKKDAESTSFYAEYKSKGPGANDKARVNWSHQLSDEEAKAFTLENIFRDWKVGDGKHK
jgi:pectinesterase